MEQETFSIGMNEQLAWNTIRHQAGGWQQAVREGGQNGIDAEGSTEVRISFDQRHTVISNDGGSRDLTDPDVRRLFLDLGESDKSGDEVGHFGIGKGTMWAVGVTKIASGRQVLVYDVKRRGLEDGVEMYTVPPEHAVDGTTVVMYHYEDQVPEPDSRRWDSYESSIRDRFSHTSQTMDVDVYINGELESDDDPTDMSSYKPTHERDVGDARIVLQRSSYGDIEVFSNGIYVRDVPGEGWTGTVIIEENLDLDIARNDIKEGCELWDEIRGELDEFRLDLFDETDEDDANEKMRDFVVDKMTEDPAVRDRFGGRPLIPTVDDQLVSPDIVQSVSRIGVADEDTHDIYADKLSQRGEVVVDSTQDRAHSFVSEFETPEEMDIREVATQEYGVDEGHQIVNDAELSSWALRRLQVARFLADQCSVDRDVLWGRDDEARAWTDGDEYIAITESLFENSNQRAWLHDLYTTMMEEVAHDDDTTGSKTHGRTFYREFGRLVDKHEDDFERVADAVHERGLRDFEPDGLTERAHDRAAEIEEIVLNLEPGDEILTNRNEQPSTVVDVGPTTLSGPTGTRWEIRPTDALPEMTSENSTRDLSHVERC